MPLTTPCPTCRIVLSYTEQHAGKQVRCPQCKTIVTTPPLQPVAAAPSQPPVPKPAPPPATQTPAPKVAPPPAPPTTPKASPPAASVAPKPPSPPPQPAKARSNPPTLEVAEVDPFAFQAETARPSRSSAERPAGKPPSQIPTGHLGWATGLFSTGLGVVLAIVVCTGFVQIVALGAAESAITVIDWLQFSVGEWNIPMVNNANYIRYFANFLLFFCLMGLLISLLGCFLAVPVRWLKPLALLAGFCLFPSYVLAVATPEVVWLADDHFSNGGGGMYHEHMGVAVWTFNLCMGGAYALGLLAAGCYLMYLRGIARSIEQPRLAKGLLLLLALLVVGSGVILLPGAVIQSTLHAITSNIDFENGFTALALQALFLAWIVFALVCFVWLVILQRKIVNAVRSASRRRF